MNLITPTLTIMTQVLGQVVPGVMFALVFRALPFAVAAAVSRQLSVTARAAVAATYLALPTSLWLHDLMPWQMAALVAAAWGYLLLAALALWAFTTFGLAARASRGGLLLMTSFLFLIVPGCLLQGPVVTLLLATGFERMFAAFSYCVEPSARRQARPLADCMQFMLVNPTLVYVAQGKAIGPPALRWRFVVRMTHGVLLSVLQGLLGMALAALGFGYGADWNWDGALERYPIFAATLFGMLLVQYVGHAGLASFQIGAMGCLGRHLPERYHYPFLARDPLDLWRRWNTYLGLWLQRYVFYPLAVRWEQRWHRAPRDAGKAAAVMATFALCGLAHELAGYARSFTWPVGALLGFLVSGAAVVVWVVLGRLARGRAARSLPAALRPLWRLTSTALTSTLLLLFGWVTLPALSGLGLPPPVLRMLGL